MGKVKALSGVEVTGRQGEGGSLVKRERHFLGRCMGTQMRWLRGATDQRQEGRSSRGQAHSPWGTVLGESWKMGYPPHHPKPFQPSVLIPASSHPPCPTSTGTGVSPPEVFLGVPCPPVELPPPLAGPEVVLQGTGTLACPDLSICFPKGSTILFVRLLAQASVLSTHSINSC